MSYTRRSKKDPLEIEAELYSTIATMDKLSKYFDKGYVGETLYRRQLKSCVSDIYKARREYDGEIDQFIEREDLKEKFPEGLHRLDLAVGSENQEKVKFHNVGELLESTANFVANAIELTDLLRLKTVAKVEFIVPLLDNMYDTLISFPAIDDDYWSLIELDGWRKELLDEKPSMVLDEDLREKLEFDTARWLDDFRRKTKDM